MAHYTEFGETLSAAINRELLESFKLQPINEPLTLDGKTWRHIETVANENNIYTEDETCYYSILSDGIEFYVVRLRADKSYPYIKNNLPLGWLRSSLETCRVFIESLKSRPPEQYGLSGYAFQTQTSRSNRLRRNEKWNEYVIFETSTSKEYPVNIQPESGLKKWCDEQELNYHQVNAALHRRKSGGNRQLIAYKKGVDVLAQLSKERDESALALAKRDAEKHRRHQEKQVELQKWLAEQSEEKEKLKQEKLRRLQEKELERQKLLAEKERLKKERQEKREQRELAKNSKPSKVKYQVPEDLMLECPKCHEFRQMKTRAAWINAHKRKTECRDCKAERARERQTKHKVPDSLELICPNPECGKVRVMKSRECWINAKIKNTFCKSCSSKHNATLRNKSSLTCEKVDSFVSETGDDSFVGEPENISSLVSPPEK